MPGSEIQSVRFNRAAWSTKDARRWLRSHGFAAIKRVDLTPRQLRYRITEPTRRYAAYRTIMLDRAHGISAIVGYRE